MPRNLTTLDPAREARARGESFAQSPQFEWLARAGLLARGFIYGIIGVLSLQLAFGSGGKTTNQQGAMKTLAQGDAGMVLLVLLAIGLFGYAAWRLTRAAIGHGPESSDDGKERVAGLASGIVYASLFVAAVQIIAGAQASSGNPDNATGGVLGWPGGPWLVGLAGLVLIGVGVEQARRGITKKFCEFSKTEQMGPGMKRFFTAAGVAGHVARAVVFALMGAFVIKAAIEFDPDKAVGLDGALAKLRDAAAGPLLLGIVAAGLICFAVYSVLDARFRRV
jgi:hypothetical protein